MRPTCRRHSKLCIIEPVAIGLRAVANTMQRWKEHKYDKIFHKATQNIYLLWNLVFVGKRLPAQVGKSFSMSLHVNSFSSKKSG
jgi:hypothetical protein